MFVKYSINYLKQHELYLQNVSKILDKLPKTTRIIFTKC